MTPEKREQTRDLLVQDLKHYRHPKERDLLRTLESRFTERKLSAKREGFVWVPVSERLPEADGDVLVHWSDGLIATLDGQRVRDNDGPETVTHWMPLPEPPIAAATKEP